MDPDKCFGKPCIRALRMPVASVRGYGTVRARGLTAISEILCAQTHGIAAKQRKYGTTAPQWRQRSRIG